MSKSKQPRAHRRPSIQPPATDGPWVATPAPAKKFAREVEIHPSEDGEQFFGLPLPLFPTFRVWHTSTRSRRAHLLILWRDYHIQRHMRLAPFTAPRKSGRVVPHLPHVRWHKSYHDKSECGAVLTTGEAQTLAGKPCPHIIDMTRPPERRKRAVFQIPAWRPGTDGGPLVPAWSAAVDPGLGGSTTIRKAALSRWCLHVAQHRPDLPRPGRLPSGTVWRFLSSVPWGGMGGLPGLPLHHIHPRDEPPAYAPRYTVVFHPSLPAPLALPGGSRRDWRPILRARLGLDPNQRLTGVRKVTVKVPPDGAEVLE